MVTLLDITRERESRPGREAAVSGNSAGLALSSVPTAPDERPVATLPEFTPEDAAAVAGGAFVVVVQIDEDRYRRRVFLTLAPAERLAVKARERGHVAHVMLAHVLPLGVVAP